MLIPVFLVMTPNQNQPEAQQQDSIVQIMVPTSGIMLFRPSEIEIDLSIFGRKFLIHLFRKKGRFFNMICRIIHFIKQTKNKSTNLETLGPSLVLGCHIPSITKPCHYSLLNFSILPTSVPCLYPSCKTLSALQ